MAGMTGAEAQAAVRVETQTTTVGSGVKTEDHKAGSKAALITGAGIGIGRGLALKLADNGYNVAVNYKNSEKEAIEVCAIINGSGKGVRAVPIKADISDIGQISGLFAEYSKYFDRLDLFINNAGITVKSPFLETSEETFDSICDVNFKGAFFCIQNAARFMIDNNQPVKVKQGGTTGNIIVISSNHYKMHAENVSVYGSVKAALTKLAGHAALELAQYGIRVNVIAPGWTDTGAARLGPKECTYDKIPLKRWCTPEELGDAVLYLASRSSDSITGASLVIDGGAVLL